MRFVLNGLFVCLVWAGMSGAAYAQQSTSEPPVSDSTAAESNGFGSEAASVADVENAAWDAIRHSAEQYVSGFNAGNAGAIADLFSREGELVDASGTVFHGRDVIQQEFTAFFAKHPDANLRVEVQQVRLVSPSVAIEEGNAEVRLSKEELPLLSRYVALHIKRKEGWRLASLRDQRVPVDGKSNLEQLSWMIGRWIDEAPESLIEIDCYWHDGGAYLIREFEIKVGGLLASSGTERIGWDPLNQQIRSWLFDSEGGFMEGHWVHKGEQWTVTASGFRSDGDPIRSTYLVTPLRVDAYHVHSFNRAAGTQDLEDLEMTIVRRPPAVGKTPVLKSSALPGSTPDRNKD